MSKKADETESESVEKVSVDKAQEITEETIENSTDEVTSSDDALLAKAGKRSAKSVKQAEVKAAKEARKTSLEDSETKPVKTVKPTRSKVERRGKKYRESAQKIEKGRVYKIDEAIPVLKSTSLVKFDATVELHVKLHVDPRLADQNIRDTLVLPAGTGKNIKIAVFTEDAEEAKKAGADITSTDQLLKELDKGNISFDILISTPALMSKLGKYARMLGPRGLMPSPKSGTVTNDVTKAVSEAKSGRIEYRVDSTGIIHVGVGKVSFESNKLADNVRSVLSSIRNNKPASIKGIYFKNAYLTSTMGPSMQIEIDS